MIYVGMIITIVLCVSAVRERRQRRRRIEKENEKG